ncbi:hypothetical protein GCM10010250_68320 [Streptomyces althioticus]|nr:hypothetical protein GCM10010250_68320 [Streptomyces althioticus]
MSTEARRASLPPRPPHAPRTAGDPGPFDPRTPLDDTPPPWTDRPASDDTDTGRPPDASGDGAAPGAWDAGTASGDDTAGRGPATPRASADPHGAGTARTEKRPGTDDGTTTVGPQRPAPDARRDGAPRGASDARGTETAERPYRATGGGEAPARPATPPASDARRTGAAPAAPAHRPAGGGVSGGPATPAVSDAHRPGAAPAEPTYRPATVAAPGSAGAAERPYGPEGDAPAGRPATPPVSDARRTGAAPAAPAHRPVGGGVSGGPATPAVSDAHRPGAAPAEPTYRPATVAAPGSAGAAERPYRPEGDAPAGRPATPPVSDARRTGAAPAAPAHRPVGGGVSGGPATPAVSDAHPTGAAPAEPTYRPAGDGTPGRPAAPPASGGRPRFPRIGGDATDRSAPPPPQASARFPDAPPTVGRGVSVTPDVAPPPANRPRTEAAVAPDVVPPPPAHRPRTETPSETTTRLRPVPAEPDPALSWSAPMSPGGVPGAGRPASVSFGEPGSRPRPFARRTRGQVVAAAVCLVLGTGLIGGAVTGAWLADGPEGPGTRHAFAVAGDLWHEVPVDQLFPPTLQGRGAGPGEADRVWTRIAVAPDSGCKGAFDALLTRVLAPVGCERLLRATYTDATQSHVTTVGLLFTEADAAGMEGLARRFERERLDRRGDLMPLPYAAKDTAAEGFGPEQRASWAISVLTDAPVVVYAVSGWADGRTVDEPQPAEDAMRPGAGTAPAQAGLGHEARGLADRFERALRQRAGTPTERPS